MNDWFELYWQVRLAFSDLPDVRVRIEDGLTHRAAWAVTAYDEYKAPCIEHVPGRPCWYDRPDLPPVPVLFETRLVHPPPRCIVTTRVAKVFACGDARAVARHLRLAYAGYGGPSDRPAVVYFPELNR